MIESTVLMCHAPIVVPEVGGERGGACRATTRAMERVARRLVTGRPDVVIVISPHAPRDRQRFGISRDPRIHFDFARFGVPALELSFPSAADATEAIVRTAREQGLETRELAPDPADHGAAVPLYFLRRAGLEAPIVVVALPYPGTNTEVAFGRVLRLASNAVSQRWSVLASGDLSHALRAGAPAGYHPQAQRFDAMFTAHLARGDLRRASQVDEALRECAHEDAVASLQVAAGATDYDARGYDFFCYEGPFGVGYAEAVLFNASAPPNALADIARESVKAWVNGSDYSPPPLDEPWGDPRAVFVTLRSLEGKLRGCVGRLEPSEKSLADEVAKTARAAATQDPRFPAVESHELGRLRFEVSVLEPAEPISTLSELDPLEYGVIVSQGERRGVLLPEVEGVDSAEEQVRIAGHKAQIDPSLPVGLERFRVHKVRGAEA